MVKAKYSRQDYEKHVAEEHKRTPFSEYLREIIYGGSDGIVTTFAVVAGFTGAQLGDSIIVGGSFLTVLLFGFANLFADATSMGLGNYLSIRSDQDVYKKEKEKELEEMRNNTEMEKVETQHILRKKGFTKQQSMQLVNIYTTNENYWLEFMMRNELNMPNPNTDNPLMTGLATFISFIFFGTIPLVPYILFQNRTDVFMLSIFSAFIALTLLGILRWKVTSEKIYRSVGEVILLGGVSAATAYFVGTFFANPSAIDIGLS